MAINNYYVVIYSIYYYGEIDSNMFFSTGGFSPKIMDDIIDPLTGAKLTPCFSMHIDERISERMPLDMGLAIASSSVWGLLTLILWSWLLWILIEFWPARESILLLASRIMDILAPCPDPLAITIEASTGGEGSRSPLPLYLLIVSIRGNGSLDSEATTRSTRYELPGQESKDTSAKGHQRRYRFPPLTTLARGFRNIFHQYNYKIAKNIRLAKQ